MSRRLVRFPLGQAAFDLPSALEAWLSLSGSRRGFLAETGDGAFIAADPFEVIRVRNGRARAGSRVLPGNPFDALGRRLARFRARGSAPFTTGAAGWLGYEMTRYLEKLPLKRSGEEACLMLFEHWIVVRGGRATLVSFAGSRRKAARLARGLAQTLKSLPPPPARAVSRKSLGGSLRGALGRRGYEGGVRRLKEHIRAGDVFQAVLSEPWLVPTRASAAAIWRALRAAGSAPYLYWLKDGDKDLVGASPERLVRVVRGRAVNCPIAGTRPRGKTPAQDRVLERRMRESPKERAEHLMLVDLARNDLGRVSAPGTVKVKTLLQTRRFPSVMHLVSEVEGRLERGKTAWDALAASFPAGTVSGAPKVRAMELLAALEPRPRGFYAGAIVQADFAGNLDSCIAIRSLALSRGVARLQAGAGIVADSRPAAEYREIQDKTLGIRRALAAAEAA